MVAPRRTFIVTTHIVGAGAMARAFGLLLTLTLLFVAAPLSRAQSEKPGDSGPAINDPLIRLMVSKGLLTTEEGRAVVAGGTADEQRNRLLVLMCQKGMSSDAEFEALRTVAPSNIPPGAR